MLACLVENGRQLSISCSRMRQNCTSRLTVTGVVIVPLKSVPYFYNGRCDQNLPNLQTRLELNSKNGRLSRIGDNEDSATRPERCLLHSSPIKKIRATYGRLMCMTARRSEQNQTGRNDGRLESPESAKRNWTDGTCWPNGSAFHIANARIIRRTTAQFHRLPISKRHWLNRTVQDSR